MRVGLDQQLKCDLEGIPTLMTGISPEELL